jgi:class 3 adenylate cyclase
VSQTRRLAAILAADVSGYSRLMGADEESAVTLPAVICHHVKGRMFLTELSRSFALIIRHNALSTVFWG